jgi:uncharacterized membrane protein
MSLEPFLSSSWVTKVHLVTVLVAIPIGLWSIFISRKGSPAHKAMGRIYFVLLIVTTLIAFFVRRKAAHIIFLGLTPGHFVSLFVLFSIWRSYSAIRRGDIENHRKWAVGMFVGAIVINGLLNTLVFSGVAHDTLFGVK